MPYVVRKYNTSMGATDRQDQNVNKYRISIRTKKWQWPLFSWGIDVTIQNAWLLFRASHPRWSLLEFRRYIVRCLLEINGRARYNQDVAIPKKDIPKELRLSEQSLQPKNPSDLHNLQSPFTCEMLLNLPHVLILHLDLLLSNVKIPALNLFFCFVMKRWIMIITCYYKKICKNTCFVFIFPFVMESSLFVITCNSKFHETSFFLVGAFMPQRWISTPSKFLGFR